MKLSNLNAFIRKMNVRSVFKMNSRSAFKMNSRDIVKTNAPNVIKANARDTFTDDTVSRGHSLRKIAFTVTALLISAAFVLSGCTANTPGSPSGNTSGNPSGNPAADPTAEPPVPAVTYDGFIELADSAEPYSASFALLGIGLARKGEGTVKAEVAIDQTMPEEAFRLDIEGKNMKITASGETGVFRALSKVSRIAADGSLPEMHLNEEPDVAYRGVIEGFYGVAWTHEFRLDLMKFMGRTNMNTYVYAPKDDAKHRAQWRDLYTDAEIARLKELVTAASLNKVKFVYAISPGLDIDLAAGYENDLKVLFDKCESMYGIGVRNFALLLDDIPTLNAEGHAKLLNDFQTRFIEKHDGAEDLIAITPEYCSAFLTGYTDTIAPLLNEKIMMMWTGNGVVPQSIRTNHLTNITRKLNRKVFIWWNYPVNDVMSDNLFLGPCENLSSDLNKNVVGLVANPMNQGYASMAPLYTTADFLWDMEGYDPDASMAAAAKLLYPECTDEYLVFEEIMRASAINNYKSAFSLKDDVSAYLAGTADAEKMNGLIAKMEGIVASLDTLKAKADPNFVKDAERWIEKTVCYARTAVALLKLDILYGDAGRSLEDKQAGALPLLDDVNTVRATIRGNSAIVSPDVLTPLFENGQKRINDIIDGLGLDVTFVPIPISNMNAYENHTLDNITDKNDSTFFWTAGALSQAPDGKGYIGLDLGRVTEIRKIEIKTGLSGRDALVTSLVEYSQDGTSWTKIASGKLGSTIVLEPEGISGRYVRVRGGNSSEMNWVIVRSFEVNGN